MSHRERPFPVNIFLVLPLLILPPVCHFAALLSSLGLFENKQLEGMYSGQWELQCGGRRKSRRNANKVDVAKPESWKKKNTLYVKFQTIASATLLTLVFP